MIIVIKKKLELEKVKKRNLSLFILKITKIARQEAYVQALLKLVKSDAKRKQQKIFLKQSVEKYSRNVERFILKNPFQINFETSILFLEIIRFGFFSKSQTIFQNKSILKYFRNYKLFLKIILFKNKFENLKDFFQQIDCEFFLKLQTIFVLKSISVSNFIRKRFFQKNSLINFSELSTDFILKKGLQVWKTTDFIDFETPINRSF